MRSSRSCCGATLVAALTSFALFTSVGCGGASSGASGGGGTQTPAPSFTLAVSPTTLNLIQDGASQAVQVSVVAGGSFSGPVTVSPTLPAGITSSPSTLAVSPSQPGTINFSASSSSGKGIQTVSFAGTSGTLSAAATMQLNVVAASLPSHFWTVGGELSHGFVDETRNLLFVTNPGQNELDVLSTANGSVTGRVAIPQPIGMDQMADGKTLVVGTATQQLVTVDEDTLVATSHPFPIALQHSSALVFPTVIAMSNGIVFAIGQEQGIDSNDIVDGGQTLFEWNSASDVYTQIQPTSSNNFTWETDRLSRSADHKWASFSADQFYLYSADSNTFTTTPLSAVNGITSSGSTFGVRGYALNHDGSKIAVASATEVSFFDRNFNLLGTAPLSEAFQTARSTVQWSTDDSQVYLAYALPLRIEIVDPLLFKNLGYLPAGAANDNLENLIANDSSHRAYFASGPGVPILDLTLKPQPYTTSGGTSSPACPSLDAVLALNTTGQNSLLYAVPTGTRLYLGGQRVSVSSNGMALTLPASSVAGLSNLECVDANGIVSLVLSTATYGIAPLGFSANLLPTAGNVPAYLTGTGFETPPKSAPPAITINTVPVTTTSLSDYDSAELVRTEGITLPTGAPGSKIDLGVTSTYGTGALLNAATYAPTATIVPTSGILQLTFDSKRNVVYALKANEVDVLDGNSFSWQTPLSFPTGTTAVPLAMALTPDGGQLVISASSSVIIVDPARNAAPKLVTLPSGSTTAGSIVATNQGTVLLAGGLILNLNTLTWSRSAVGLPQVLRASLDGSRVLGADLNDSGGDIYIIDPAGQSRTGAGFGESFSTDLAISSDGMHFATVFAPPYATGDLYNGFNQQLSFVSTNVYPTYVRLTGTGVLGATISPGGSVLVAPLGDSIDFWDFPTGKLRARMITPEPLQTYAYPENAVAPVLAMNTAGDTLYVASKSGLTILPLPTALDNLPTMAWPEVLRGVTGAFTRNLLLKSARAREMSPAAK
jgi:hypothetical protein